MDADEEAQAFWGSPEGGGARAADAGPASPPASAAADGPPADGPLPAPVGDARVTEPEAAPPPKRPRHRALVFSANNGEGELVFLPTSTASAPRRVQPRHGDMLSTPIHVLRARIDADARARAARDEPAGAASASPARSAGGKRARSPATAPRSPAAGSADLWARKYAPRKFTQLVSDETVNRAVLHWVKSWDGLVFGGRGAGKGAPPRAGGAQLNARAWAGSDWPATGGGSGGGGSGAAPSEGPPTRVLLLWGPPGLGKTTLAHVVARQAGYNPVEINASDERSAGAMRTAREAMQTAPLFGDKRPKLLILDEIDGALGGSEGASAIGALLKMLAPAGGGAAAPSGPGSAGLINRPVICVANDAFAPALRPLRAVAEVVEMGPVSLSKLQGRLKAICAAERVDASADALATLVDMQQGDVRSCLHALQLLARRRSRARLQPADVRASGVGVRDGGCDELGLLARLLCKPPASTGSAASRASAAAAEAELNRLLFKCDVSRLLDGSLEHHASMYAIDTSMQRAVRMGEWLSWAASLCDARGRDGGGAAGFGVGQAYGAWAGRALRLECAVPRLGPRAVRFPRCAVDARQRASRTERTLALVRAGFSPSLSRAFPTVALRCEVLSPLAELLVPANVRPLPMHLLTAEERGAVAQLVDTMLATGLTLRQARNAAGAIEYQLEPPLSELLLDPDSALSQPDGPAAAGEAAEAGGAGAEARTVAAPQQRHLPYTLAAAISTELGRERIRRLHVTAAGGAGGRRAPPPVAAGCAATAGPSAAGGAGNAEAGHGSGADGPAGPTSPDARTASAHGAGGTPKHPAPPLPATPAARAAAKAPARSVEIPRGVSISTWATIKPKERKEPAPGGKRSAAQAAIGSDAASPAAAGNGPDKSGAAPAVRYKHHEGVTNAVRRTVRVQDLL